MEIRQLRSFCKIAELGSFSRAAGVLHLTQPALGLQIRNLEEELGVPLLTRHSRGVALTPHGMRLLQHAEAILAGVNSAFLEFKESAHSAKATVKIGMAPSLAVMLSRPLLQRVEASAGNLRVDLAEAPSKYLNDWVAEGAIDLAIACDGPVSAHVRREEVLREALYLVQAAAPNEPAIGAPINFVDLAGLPLIIADPLLTRQLVDKLQAAAASAGIELKIQSVLTSTTLVKNAVEDREGATVLPYAVVRRECEQGRLRIRQIVGPSLIRTAYLLLHAERPQPQSLSQLIRDVISEQIGGAPAHGHLVEAA